MRAVAPGDESPNVRESDPTTSHTAAARAVSKVDTITAVTHAMQNLGHPATAGDIWEQTLFLKERRCTPQRVRTVLAEGERAGLFHSVEGGRSEYGNPARLWSLAVVTA